MSALIEIKEFHLHVDLKEVSSDAKKILHEVLNIKQIVMATKEQFQAAFDQMTSSIDNIAADIQKLTGQLQTGGLSEADENEILAQLQAKADQLKSIADQTPDDAPAEA